MESVLFVKSALPNQLDKALKTVFEAAIKKSNRVVVVQRMAPPRALPDLDITKDVIRLLIEMNAKPFLYDSPKIEGPLKSAKEYLKEAKQNGYTRDSFNCPVIVGEDPFSTKAGTLKIGICRDIYESDALVIINRFSGSSLLGANTALSNIANNGVVIASKKALGEAAEKEQDKKVQKNPRKIDKHIADVGKALLSKFRKKLVIINDARKICMTEGIYEEPGKKIAKSAGIFIGQDILSVDAATIDAILKKDGSVFTKTYKLNPIFHLQEAQSIGLGSMDFELTKP